MSVVRVEKKNNYTVMSNYHLDDMRLSLKAIGLLSKILRLPPDWDYTIEGLSKICAEGKSAIRSAIEELETAGYIVRRRTHGKDGTFAGNEYVVYEEPLSENPTMVPSSENCTMVPSSENPSLENPSLENPSLENPSLENRTQINTNITNNLNTKPPISPKGERGERKAPKKEPEWKPERFEAFWNYYPAINGQRPAKARAVRAWDKLKPDDETIACMGRALKRQKKTEMWQQSIGIPYASTYLNQRRWEDEVDLATIPPEDESSWAPDPEMI